MKKRMYRKVSVKQVNVESILAGVGDWHVTVAVDVAKVDMVACLANSSGEVLATVGWKSPQQNGAFMDLLRTLVQAGVRPEAVMEPTATYGDVLRYQLHQEGVPVYRVQGKRTFDAREVLDGVPSLHDAKSAAVLVLLHTNGLSRLWEEDDEDRRRLKAAIAAMDLHRDYFQRLQGKLESQLARYWPELSSVVDLSSASVLALLARIGGPGDVARGAEEAKLFLRGMSHRLMKEERIDAIVSSAGATIGVPAIDEERRALMELAGEAHRVLKSLKQTRARVEKLSEAFVPAPQQELVGLVTAAVFVADVGAPSNYASARSYMKAFGLNLREKSSGKKQGALHITKRGPARARAYLWLAALRWLQEDPIVRAWYDQKVERDGDTRKKAVVALMRKLAKALYVVGLGQTLHTARLFDVTRLRIAR
jgi:transposase